MSVINYEHRDKVVMPASLPQTIRGSNVAVTITMVLTRVRSTSTGTMAVLTVTTRGARCLSLVTTVIKKTFIVFHSVIMFTDIMVMHIVEILFLFRLLNKHMNSSFV